ncbi:MAG TPA: YceI family protein [Dermatophilaceae bacterium]|nr:YceI family protein [Dermatophilaceae bacterium]
MNTFPGLTPGTWTVDPSHSEVGFVARHLMVTKVRGRFGEVAGTVTVGEDLATTHVEATAEVGSITTGNADRDAHLRSGDFFDADTYPQLRFVSTSVTTDSLTGELTIKDVTREVTFDLDFEGVATDPWGNTKAAFSATTKVDRTDWGLTWNAALETGGVLVSEKVDIVLEVQLVKA